MVLRAQKLGAVCDRPLAQHAGHLSGPRPRDGASLSRGPAVAGKRPARLLVER